MTHTAGLTYGWMFNHPVDAMYRSAGFEWEHAVRARPRRLAASDWRGCRCVVSPAAEWNYSVATDVSAASWRW